MDQGSLRCDANVSIRPAGTETLGTKTELKNMNSFRYLERGVDAEIARQRAIVAAGEEVQQETLHFDPASGSLTPLRSKEFAHDYRYFPEPDLVPLAPSEEDIAAAHHSLPELPEQRRERYAESLGLGADLAQTLAFDADLANFFESAMIVNSDADAPAIANWVTGELVAASRAAGVEHVTESKASPAAVAALAGMVASKAVSRNAGREILTELAAEGGDPAEIAERRGLGAQDDAGELEAIVAGAIEADPEAAAKVKAGEGKAIGALVGAVMRETRGRADGGEVTRLIRRAPRALSPACRAGLTRLIRRRRHLGACRAP